jgi:hypothetical protein
MTQDDTTAKKNIYIQVVSRLSKVLMSREKPTPLDRSDDGAAPAPFPKRVVKNKKLKFLLSQSIRDIGNDRWDGRGI